jgi:hypothetical protein
MYEKSGTSSTSAKTDAFLDGVYCFLDRLESDVEAQALGTKVGPEIAQAAHDNKVGLEIVIGALKKMILQWAGGQNGEANNEQGTAANGRTDPENTTPAARMKTAFLGELIKQLSAL